ncbi:MAG: Fe-S cluster assembly sulfur transfer protein SufU [Anaerorhabdus sp.]
MSGMLDDPNVLRELIMDHYQYPRNHQLVKDDKAYSAVHMASESCIDDIEVQAKINNDKIEDVRFDGVACTISTASTSMMTELLIGKSIAEAKEIMNHYFSMIDEKPYDEEILQEAIAMKGVSKQASRIKCATIGWNAMAQLLNEGGNKDE